MDISSYNHRRLFILSLVALLAIGFSFSLRSSVASDLESVFRGISIEESAAMVGAVLGIAFLGYAFTIALVSPFLDAFGMKPLMIISSLCLILGTLVVCFYQNLAGESGEYWVIWGGMLIIGIGWGLVDTVTNPLTCSLYPDDKVHKLNVLHAWWPAGIMLGGLIGLGLDSLGMVWQTKLAVTCVPALVYGLMAFTCEFPPTERKAAGVSFRQMFDELWRRPMFWILFFAMFLTSASELAPGQWVDIALTRTVGMRGIWLLIYVSGLMFVMRHFAGPIVHKISSIGLLWVSCLLTAGGLVSLSFAYSPATGLLAATLWGVGVCFLWPTMLATTAERFPKGGALLLGMMGTAGTLSIKFFLPIMGGVFDTAKVEVAGGAEAFASIESDSERMHEVLSAASRQSFLFVAWLPLFLLLIFGVIWISDKKRSAKLPNSNGHSEPS